MRAVNLIPTDQRPGAGGTYGRSGGVAYALVALVAGLVGMSVLYLMARRDLTQRTAQVAHLSAQAQQTSSEASVLAAYNSFVAMSNSRVSQVEALAQDRFDWAHAFHELGRVLPFDVSLTTVTGTIASTGSTSGSTPAAPTGTTGATGATGASAASTPAGSSSTPAGSVPSLQITGCTTSQSAVAYTMQRLALMDGVTNVTLQSSVAGGTSTSSASAVCPDVFALSVTFTALPTVSPTSASGAAPTPTVGEPAPANTATAAASTTAAAGATPSAAATAPTAATSAPSGAQ